MDCVLKKKLLELARAGCHEVDCMHTRQVSYKFVSSYTERVQMDIHFIGCHLIFTVQAKMR